MQKTLDNYIRIGALKVSLYDEKVHEYVRDELERKETAVCAFLYEYQFQEQEATASK